MNITDITEAIQRDAVWVVFANVLLQQLGMPVPAVPTLLLAGSLAMSYGHAGKMLAAAILASMVADWLWYLAGRAFGYRVLTGLCKLSINPGSCVSSAESLFMRWGAWSLVVAKFVPGFSTVGPPIAGSMRLPLPSFFAAAGLGAGLWAGAAILAGWLLRAEVQWAIDAISRHGMTAAGAIVIAFGTWLAWKLWQKYRFERLAAIPHITAAELRTALDADRPPLLLDLRGKAAIASAGPIARATQVQLTDLPGAISHWPTHDPVVTMCACPGDATAVRAAHTLTKAGYLSVRPLKGGFEAWARELQTPR
jgi:membrane protein DedA with SNARE-associated domain/rhodanese-related sulfurtransferase